MIKKVDTILMRMQFCNKRLIAKKHSKAQSWLAE